MQMKKPEIEDWNEMIFSLWFLCSVGEKITISERNGMAYSATSSIELMCSMFSL
jgi:hypothetical protein